MPTFKYSAVDSAGKTRNGVLEAETLAAAGDSLKTRGLIPLDVRLLAQGSSRSGTGRFLRGLDLSLGSGVSSSMVTAAIRQLSTLLGAGLPLDNSLSTMIGRGRIGPMQRILVSIRDRIREGGDLAAAFAEHPRVFNETFVTMVRAGEASGSLDVVMERLAEHMEQQLAISRKLRATLAYPAFMLVVGVGVVAFLLMFVVPKITQIFLDMKQALPLPTQILISLSGGLARFWPFLLVGALLLGLGLARYVRSPSGRKTAHSVLLHLPLLGRVVRLGAVGRTCKTLGLLLKNEVSLVPALLIVRSVAGNAVIEESVSRMHQGVQEGRSLWEFMEAAPIFPSTAVQLVAAGERSGNLAKMLLVVADDCEKQVEARLQVLMSLLEPAMILMLSVVVGFVVMAIILPIFEMSNLVG